jgi:hypothetical protein
MIAKLLGLAVLGGIGFIAVGSLPELKRYLKIRNM